ncbi:cellulase family glycosylhydrolase [Deinococcus misasensis]|uniref:cellulase family glycosylhydrolase n=1 Tax=Deinococcus misasensis TaxID=392413 RepID=UPI00068BB2A9|nr:cellulase family glycosylhydrolase [Deinococcus misasensis]
MHLPKSLSKPLVLISLGLLTGLTGCQSGHTLTSESLQVVQKNALAYSATVAVTNQWQGGHQGSIKVVNTSGEPITSFAVLLKFNTEPQLGSAWNGTLQKTASGYLAQSPDWLKYSPVKAGGSFEVGFTAVGAFSGAQVIGLTINGKPVTDTADTTPPSVPSGLTASGISSNSVTLSWTKSTDNVGVTGYQVFNGNTLMATVATTSALISGLAANTSYAFTVKAQDAAGNTSLASNILTVKTSGTVPPPSNIFDLNKKLSKTINFGNILEAPKEGDWGLVLEERFFDKAKEAGFTAIRLPVRFSTHAQSTAPYTIDPAFFARVDYAISEAKKRGLAIIIDMHHYEELFSDPANHLERFTAMWDQIATRYKNEPESVFFELMNEPNTKLEPLWNDYLQAALTVVRKTNPTRAVIVGPNGWNNAERFPELKLPASDQNLIVTFHNYVPFNFTHQGATWISPVPPTGVVWPAPGKTLAPTWQNWSWDTTVGSTATGLSVQYQKANAGFYMHSDTGIPTSGYDTLKFVTDKSVTLGVLCIEDHQATPQPAPISVTTRAGEPTLVPLSSCGKPVTVRDIRLQNFTTGALNLQVEGMELTGPSGSKSLLGTAEDEVRFYMQLGANYGKANNRPVFMGEFGAFNMADMASRERWTRFVRTEAEKMNMGWGYWELASGFGVLDPVSGQWNTGLLNALFR